MKYLSRVFLLLMFTLFLSVQMIAFPAFAEGSTINPYETFLATSYDSVGSGITVLADRVGKINPSNWVCFENVDFGTVGPYAVEIETTTPSPDSTTKVLIKLDASTGTVFAEIPITPSSDWGVGLVNFAEITAKVTGVHDIYITCANKAASFRSIVFYTHDGADKEFKYERYSQTTDFSDVVDEELAIKTLVNLGIISLNDDKSYDLKKSVTRGEFANSIFRLFVEKNEEDAKSINTRFTDVKADYKYVEAIDYLSQRGFMNGVSENEFSPNSYITYIDALTVISRALGYKEVAELKGGYPNGYIQVAANIKIALSDIGFNDYIKRRDMVCLLQKTLFADYLTIDSIMNDGVVFGAAEGILSETRHIYNGEGIVKATALSMINMPDSELSIDEVDIDGRKYKTGDLDVFGLLGFECDFWYCENDGVRTLCSITPSASVKCTEISSEEITLISDSKINYIPTGKTKEKTISISSDTSVIYNGVAIDKNITNTVDYEDSFTGTICYIENGNGNEILLIDEYNDYVVESVEYFTSTLKCVGFDDEITLDDEENFVSIVDSNGRTVEVSKLKIGDIVTVYQSKNSSGPKVVRVYLSDKTIKGDISQINHNDDKIVIGNKEYKKSNHYSGDLSLSQSGIFYLNIYDEIVKFDVNNEESALIGMFIDYAYIKEAFDGYIQIKLIDSNGQSQIYNVAPKVTYNGKKIKNIEEIVNDISYNGKYCYGLENLPEEEIFRYTLNSNGEISMIDTYEQLLGDTNDTLLKHNDSKLSMKYSKDAGILSTDGSLKLYMNGDSLVYSYYTDIEEKEEFWRVGLAKSTFTNSVTSVKCLTYSTKNNMYMADVAVFERTMEYGVDWEAPIIIETVSRGLDETGCDAVIIEGYGTNGQKVKYIVSSETVPFDNKRALLESVKEGDIIRVKIVNDMISDAGVVFFCDGSASRTIVGGETIHAIINKNNVPVSGSGLSWRYIYGKVCHVDSDFIVVESLSIDDEGNETINTEVLSKPQSATLYSVGNRGRTLILAGKPISAISLGDTVIGLFSYDNVSQIIVYDFD